MCFLCIIYLYSFTEHGGFQLRDVSPLLKCYSMGSVLGSFHVLSQNDSNHTLFVSFREDFSNSEKLCTQQKRDFSLALAAGEVMSGLGDG